MMHLSAFTSPSRPTPSSPGGAPVAGTAPCFAASAKRKRVRESSDDAPRLRMRLVSHPKQTPEEIERAITAELAEIDRAIPFWSNGHLRRAEDTPCRAITGSRIPAMYRPDTPACGPAYVPTTPAYDPLDDLAPIPEPMYEPSAPRTPIYDPRDYE